MLSKAELQARVGRLCVERSDVTASVVCITSLDQSDKDSTGDPRPKITGYQLVLSAPYTESVDIPLSVTDKRLGQIVRNALKEFTAP